MISLAEFDYRESRNSIDNLCDLAEMSSFKLYERADRKNKASFKLSKDGCILCLGNKKEKKVALFDILNLLNLLKMKEPLIT